jgi:hypothetical protein
VGPKEKHYLCVSFAIEIQTLHKSFQLSMIFQMILIFVVNHRGKDKKKYILGEVLLFSHARSQKRKDTGGLRSNWAPLSIAGSELDFCEFFSPSLQDLRTCSGRLWGLCSRVYAQHLRSIK